VIFRSCAASRRLLVFANHTIEQNSPRRLKAGYAEVDRFNRRQPHPLGSGKLCWLQRSHHVAETKHLRFIPTAPAERFTLLALSRNPKLPPPVRRRFAKKPRAKRPFFWNDL
jgi:hypothetical protein